MLSIKLKWPREASCIGFWRTRTSNEFGLIALENSDHMPGEFGPIALENSALLSLLDIKNSYPGYSRHCRRVIHIKHFEHLHYGFINSSLI